MAVIDDYFSALKRLVDNRPVRVERNTRISNDTVALEAGRQKGSIKRSRDSFKELISAIDVAKRNQHAPQSNSNEKYKKMKIRMENYRTMYERGLAREIVLLKKIWDLEVELEMLQQSKIVAIRKKSRGR